MALDLQTALGIDATFVPEVGDQIANVKIFRDQLLTDQPGGFTGTAKAYEYEIEFLFSDIGRLPEVGEQFVVGALSYVVARIIDHDIGGRFCKIACVLND